MRQQKLFPERVLKACDRRARKPFNLDTVDGQLAEIVSRPEFRESAFDYASHIIEARRAHFAAIKSRKGGAA